MIRISLALCLALFALSFAETGDTAKAPQKEVKASKVAKDFNIPEDSVKALRNLYKVGNGEVSKALALSQKSGLSVDEILKMKTEQKMGWGQIAKKLNLEPGKDYKAEEKQDSAIDKKEAGQAKKQENMEQKAEKKADQAEKKAEKNKGEK
jgi:hypothetical protein